MGGGGRATASLVQSSAAPWVQVGHSRDGCAQLPLKDLTHYQHTS